MNRNFGFISSILLFVCVVLVLSCSVQKRHYRKGFYVEHGKQKPYSFSSTHKITERGNKHKTSPHGIVKTEEPLTVSAENLIPGSTSKSALPIQEMDKSCDTLFLKDGSKIAASVKEIGYKDIRYKLCDFLEGPDYLVEKYRLNSVIYSNGLKEDFSMEAPPSPASTPKPEYQKRDYKGNEKNSNASLSLSFGILGFYPLPIIGSIIGLVFGIVANNEVKREPNRYSNGHIARIGLTVSIATFLFWLMLIVYFVII